MYSLREGRNKKKDAHSTSSIPYSHPSSSSKTMKTHFPRERGRESARARRRRRQAKFAEFGGGHSNNDSIHSFTPVHLPTTYVPTTHFFLILPLWTPVYTVYFPWQTNHAPSLAHNHSTFMEMCVIAVRYRMIMWFWLHKEWSSYHEQTNGVWCRHIHPTHYYSFTLQMPLWGETPPLSDYYYTRSCTTHIL